MTNAQHTSTPWHYAEITPTGNLTVNILDNNGAVICIMKAAHGNKVANAAFIVKAANLHEELLQTLKGLLHVIDTVPIPVLSEDIGNARRAIEKAEAQ